MKGSELLVHLGKQFEDDGVDVVQFSMDEWREIHGAVETLEDLAAHIAWIVRPGGHELAKLIDGHTTDEQKDKLLAVWDWYQVNYGESGLPD